MYSSIKQGLSATAAGWVDLSRDLLVFIAMQATLWEWHKPEELNQSGEWLTTYLAKQVGSDISQHVLSYLTGRPIYLATYYITVWRVSCTGKHVFQTILQVQVTVSSPDSGQLNELLIVLPIFIQLVRHMRHFTIAF